MAAEKGFEAFETIFGEVTLELDSAAKSGDESDVISDAPLRRCLFLARALDTAHLEVVATDFHSLTFSRVLSVHDLEDLRDDIGIAGSWSEFVDYFRSSFSSGDVKLVIGTAHAKILAFKAKGLPRVSLLLHRAMNISANDAMSTLSLEIFEASRNNHMNIVKVGGVINELKNLLVQEFEPTSYLNFDNTYVKKERSSELMKIISSEREKNEDLQRQLDSLSFSSKRKVPKLTSDKTSNGSDNLENYEKTLVSEPRQPSELSYIKDSQIIKTTHRPAPVSHRARVRGVTLQDTSDNDGD